MLFSQNLRGILLGQVLALLLCQQALAETEASESDQNPEQEQIVQEQIEIRAKRIEEDALRPTAGLVVIRPEDLGPGLHALSDLARMAPAVRVRELGGLGQPFTLGLRGAAGHQTRILLDGMPLPDGMGAGVDLSFLPVDFLDRVEILRGAASVGGGSGALGGRVDLRTRALGKAGWFARLSAGSFGTWSGAGGAAWSAGGAKVMLLMSGLSTAGDFTFPDDGGTPHNPFDDQERLRENNDARRLGLLLKIDKPLGRGFRLRLMQTVHAHDRGVAGMLGFTSREAREQGLGSLSSLSLTAPLGPGSLEIAADLQVDSRRFNDPLGDLTGVPIHQEQEEKSAGVQARYRWAPLDSWLFSTRLEGRHEGLWDARFGDPGRMSLAGSSAAEWEPWLDGRLALSMAMRLEAFERDGLQWAPSLGLRWRLGDGFCLRLNLARAYRVPSFSELYMEAGYAVGNPELEVEKAWSADASVAWEKQDRLKLRLTGFYSRHEELIVFEPGANFRYRPLNVGAADLAGVELEAKFSLSEQLGLGAQYSFLYSVDRSGLPNREGNALPGRPAHSAGIWTSWDLGRWFARGGLHWVGTNFINAANTKELRARLLLDVTAGLKLDGFQLALQGLNLLNDRIQDVRGLPLPGLGVFLTLSWRI